MADKEDEDYVVGQTGNGLGYVPNSRDGVLIVKDGEKVLSTVQVHGGMEITIECPCSAKWEAVPPIRSDWPKAFRIKI